MKETSSDERYVKKVCSFCGVSVTTDCFEARHLTKGYLPSKDVIVYCFKCFFKFCKS